MFALVRPYAQRSKSIGTSTCNLKFCYLFVCTSLFLSFSLAYQPESSCKTYQTIDITKTCFMRERVLDTNWRQGHLCTRTVQHQTIDLSNCHCAIIPNNESNSCIFYATDANLFVKFETTYLKPPEYVVIADDKYLSKAYDTSLTLRYSPASPSKISDITRPMLPVKQFRVKNITIENFTFDSESLKYLDPVMNFHKETLDRVTYNLASFNSILPIFFFNYKNFNTTREFIISNSVIAGTDRYSFVLSRTTSLFRLYNVTVSNLQKIGYDLDGYAGQNNNSTTRIEIKRCNLNSNKIPRGILLLEGAGGKGHSKVHLDLTDNSFNGEIRDTIFKDMILKAGSVSSLTLEIDFDPIDCCSHRSGWLGELLSEKKFANVRVNAECRDIGGKLGELVNEAKIASACGRKRAIPVLSIVIVTILILAALLATISFVCIFYIIPRKGNVITITRTRGVSSESSDTPTVQSGFSKTGKSRDMSIFELESSKTVAREGITNKSAKQQQNLTRPKRNSKNATEVHDANGAKGKEGGPNPELVRGSKPASNASLKLPKQTFKLPQFKTTLPIARKTSRERLSKLPKSPKSPKSPIHHNSGLRSLPSPKTYSNLPRYSDVAKNKKSPRSPLAVSNEQHLKTVSNQKTVSPLRTISREPDKTKANDKETRLAILESPSNRSNVTGMSQALKTTLT